MVYDIRFMLSPYDETAMYKFFYELNGQWLKAYLVFQQIPDSPHMAWVDQSALLG